MSTLKADTIQNTSGGAATLTKQHAAKAWINLNGDGTAAITDSFNITSIADNGTGNYTITMTNGMSNANYSLAGLVGDGTGSFNRGIATGYQTAPTSSAFKLTSITSSSGGLTDCSYVSSQVMGDLA